MKKFVMSTVAGVGLVAAMGCGHEAGGGADQTMGRAGQAASDADISIASFDMDSEECAARQCVLVTSSKDISHIDVDALPCEGVGISYELYRDDDGTWVLDDTTPTTVGNDKSCDPLTVSPDAVKFDGLSDPEYVVCIRYEGASVAPAATFIAKAGQTCEARGFQGECTLCTGGTGGGSPATTSTTAGVGGSTEETTSVTTAGVGGSTTETTSATGAGGCTEDHEHGHD